MKVGFHVSAASGCPGLSQVTSITNFGICSPTPSRRETCTLVVTTNLCSSVFPHNWHTASHQHNTHASTFLRQTLVSDSPIGSTLETTGNIQTPSPDHWTVWAQDPGPSVDASRCVYVLHVFLCPHLSLPSGQWLLNNLSTVSNTCFPRGTAAFVQFARCWRAQQASFSFLRETATSSYRTLIPSSQGGNDLPLHWRPQACPETHMTRRTHRACSVCSPPLPIPTMEPPALPPEILAVQWSCFAWKMPAWE
jgi:hypothetical protein